MRLVVRVLWIISRNFEVKERQLFVGGMVVSQASSSDRSRSNYGAVERILKNYETAAKNLNRQKEPASSPNLSVGQESDKYMDMLDMDSVPIPLFIRETLPSHPTQMQRSSHKVLELQELTVQVGQV